MSDRLNLPAYLKAWREAQALTQAETAAALDLSVSQVSHIEQGQRTFRHRTMLLLACQALAPNAHKAALRKALQ